MDKTTTCEMCGKTIPARGARKFCASCRIKRDKQISIEYRRKHNKTGKFRKPVDFV